MALAVVEDREDPDDPEEGSSDELTPGVVDGEVGDSPPPQATAMQIGTPTHQTVGHTGPVIRR